MNSDVKKRPSLEDMVYFSYLNFAASHKLDIGSMKNIEFQEADRVMLNLVREYTRNKSNNVWIQGHIDPSICSTVIYQDMIKKAGALVYVPKEEIIPYENPDQLLRLILAYNKFDDEASPVIGGVLGENIAMEFVTAHNQVDSIYDISSRELLKLFLPADFSDIHSKNERGKRGARNLGIVGAALLGPVEGAEYSEVLALKQSIYGMWGKTLRVRAKVNQEGYPTYYALDEVIFVTEAQIKGMHGIPKRNVLSQINKGKKISRKKILNCITGKTC